MKLLFFSVGLCVIYVLAQPNTSDSELVSETAAICACSCATSKLSGSWNTDDWIMDMGGSSIERR